MTTSEAGLLDTNILVYAADETSPFHKTTIGLREKGLKGKIPLSICPQVLNEFFAIVTDPRRVSNSISQREAILEIEKYFYAKNIMKIYPGPEIIERTLDLLVRYEITKQEIFD